MTAARQHRASSPTRGRAVRTVGNRALATYYATVDSLTTSAAESVSDVTAALVSRTAEVAADIFALIVQEIPQLRSDQRVLTLLEPASMRT